MRLAGQLTNTKVRGWGKLFKNVLTKIGGTISSSRGKSTIATREGGSMSRRGKRNKINRTGEGERVRKRGLRIKEPKSTVRVRRLSRNVADPRNPREEETFLLTVTLPHGQN